MVRHNFIRIGKTELKLNYGQNHATRDDSAINQRRVDPAIDQEEIGREAESKMHGRSSYP